MSNELKRIKELYGENFAHLCRQLFPTILESEGILLKILTNSFNPSKFLYDDIMDQSQKENFRGLIFYWFEFDKTIIQEDNVTYIHISANKELKKERVITDKKPSELLSEAGYDLYECNTEEEIQSFKKYFRKGEELCTFNGGRLESDFVFFAVKKNAEKINRNDFIRPKRQDSYGTSVISIQFRRGDSNVLSIKNRYNHHVDNPDATFGNNLENIIRGLTYSFEQEYKLDIVYNKGNFELNNYFIANCGMYFKYNAEIDRVYYCANNTIIRDGKITKLDPCRYLLIDYFIIDLQNKTITMEENGDEFVDSFLGNIGEIDKLSILNTEYGKEITITPKDKEKKNTIIKINKTNGIIGVYDANLKFGDRDYLKYCNRLTELDVPSVKETGINFLSDSENLEELNMPSAVKIGDNNLFFNKGLRKISLESAVSIGSNLLYNNEIINEINMPLVETIDDDFIPSANGISDVRFDSLIRIKNNFLHNNKSAKVIIMPFVQEIGKEFMSENTVVEKVYMPLVTRVGDFFLNNNTSLIEIDLPSLKIMGSSCLFHNTSIERASLPSIKIMGPSCFGLNQKICNQLYQQINKYRETVCQSDTSQLYSSHV